MKGCQIQMSENWKSIMIEGDIGSEGGIVLADEEYKEECRITLEKRERYHAITCGVYGDMLHTAFCREEEANSKYEAMKAELKEFVDASIEDLQARSRFYAQFTSKY